MKKTLLFAIVGAFLFINPYKSNAAYYSYSKSVYSFVTENTSTIKFQVYIPDDVDTLRGIYFYTNGGNMRSYNFPTNNAQYRNFVAENDFALLGADLEGNSLLPMYFFMLDSIIADVVFEAMDSIAVESNHPELSVIPYFLEGSSNGGSFSFNFAMARPTRTLGYIDIKGSFIINPYYFDSLDAQKKVPGYLISGENDQVQLMQHIQPIFTLLRFNEAPLSYYNDLGAGHGRLKDTSIFYPYFREICNLRLPATFNFDTLVPLKDLDLTKGYLGDLQTKIIGEWDYFDVEKGYAPWFPSEAIAQRWQSAASEGSITDKLDSTGFGYTDTLYFGETPPENEAKLFAPGLVSVAGRDEVRFEVSASQNYCIYSTGLTYAHNFPGNSRGPYANDPYQRQYYSGGNLNYYSNWDSVYVPNNLHLQPYTFGGFLRGSDSLIYTDKYTRLLYTGFPSSDTLDTFALFNIPNADDFENIINPWFTEDSNMFAYNKSDSGLYFSEWHNEYGYPERVTSNKYGYTFVNKTADTMIYSPDNKDLYISLKDSTGVWQKGLNLGRKVNTKYRENVPVVTGDGKYLFFSRYDEPGGYSNIYWIGTNVFKGTIENTPPEQLNSLKDTIIQVDSNFTYDLSQFVFDADANDSMFVSISMIGSGMPSTIKYNAITQQIQGKYIREGQFNVLVKVMDNYFAEVRDTFQLSFVKPVNFNPVTHQTMRVYPNPATDKINIDLNNLSEVKIFSQDGKLQIYETYNEINTEHLTNGLYIIQAKDLNGHNYISKFIIRR